MFKTQATAIVSALKCRKGAAMVEYGLLTALIAAVGAVALTSLGSSISTMFTALASKI
jgi:pilus assembly protein Flp/PilA